MKKFSESNIKIRLVIVIIVLLILFWLLYPQGIEDSISTIVLLFNVGIILLFVRENWTKKKAISDEIFLAAAAIIIGIVLFELQNLQTIQDTYDKLKSVNKYNCEVGRDLGSEIIDTENTIDINGRIRRRFETDVYKNQIDYLLRKFKGNDPKDIFETIGMMDQTNRLLDLSMANYSSYFPTILNLNDRSKTMVIHQAFSNLSKSYDDKILGLSKEILINLRKIDIKLNNNISDTCVGK